MKAVLISIRPKWVEKIASGEKTLEVRKTRPKLETPFKCYIYCTNTRPFLVWGDVFRGDWCTEFTRLSGYGRAEADSIWDVFNGHVAGEFVCDTIFPVTVECSSPADLGTGLEVPGTCLTDREILDYLGNGKQGYLWHISGLKLYGEPKELSEFCFPPELYCEKGLCGRCPYDQSPNEYGEYSFDCEWKRPITRPPQSWCYVEG